MSIGQRIKVLRKSRGLTQVQLAKAVGRNQSTISDMERGASFDAEVLQALCEALETTSTYIMRGGNSEADLHEAELVGLFRALPEADQAQMVKMLRALVHELAPKKALKFKTTR